MSEGVKIASKSLQSADSPARRTSWGVAYDLPLYDMYTARLRQYRAGNTVGQSGQVGHRP